ncbi:MAG: hypothetical protein V4579_03835 [Pseudomonadota bacterium]
MHKSTKRWLKAAVVTFGVVDCVGIYIAHDRLSRPVELDAGSDLAYAVAAPTDAFAPDQQRAAAAAPPAVASAGVNVAPAEAAAPTAREFTPREPAMATVQDGPIPTARALALLRANPTADRDGQASSAAGPTQLAGLVAQPAYAPLFADAFGSGFASVPLDAPIAVPLAEAPGDDALAQANGAGAVELAQNGGTAGADSGGAAESADSMPEAGPGAILPDSDVL